MSESPFGKPPTHDSRSGSPDKDQEMEIDKYTTEQLLDVPLQDQIKLSQTPAPAAPAAAAPAAAAPAASSSAKASAP
eukprot:7885181-Karenia_brevis.AAC.1